MVLLFVCGTVTSDRYHAYDELQAAGMRKNINLKLQYLQPKSRFGGWKPTNQIIKVKITAESI